MLHVLSDIFYSMTEIYVSTATCTLARKPLPWPLPPSSQEAKESITDDTYRRVPITAVVAVFIVPLIASVANHCNLLSPPFWPYAILRHHQTVEPQFGVYQIHYFGFPAQCFTKCALIGPENPIGLIHYMFMSIAWPEYVQHIWPR